MKSLKKLCVLFFDLNYCYLGIKPGTLFGLGSRVRFSKIERAKDIEVDILALGSQHPDF